MAACARKYAFLLEFINSLLLYKYLYLDSIFLLLSFVHLHILYSNIASSHSPYIQLLLTPPHSSSLLLTPPHSSSLLLTLTSTSPHPSPQLSHNTGNLSRRPTWARTWTWRWRRCFTSWCGATATAREIVPAQAVSTAKAMAINGSMVITLTPIKPTLTAKDPKKQVSVHIHTL
jgi:hypothetical protein